MILPVLGLDFFPGSELIGSEESLNLLIGIPADGHDFLVASRAGES